MSKIVSFVKKESVLCISILAAVISMFIVRPDSEYAGYIDFRTLAILFCLMAVVSGFRSMGIFDRVARTLLSKVRGIGGIAAVLVGICFISSMFITNDVALITFVPFTLIIADSLKDRIKESVTLTIVVMQTIAANLGSMLTPIGNPQNLYLSGISGMGTWDIVKLMFPYSAAAFIMLAIWIAIIAFRNRRCKASSDTMPGDRPQVKPRAVIMYAALFIVSLLAVVRVVHYVLPLALVIICMVVFDRKNFTGIDYSLLGTFAALFIFIGNIGRIGAFNEWMQNIVTGREIMVSAAASQIMSNVPAAILLSGFTDNIQGLIVGTNIGGLGTLIASMASLISFRYVAGTDRSCGKYLAVFTISNLVFLAVMMGISAI